jgi:hypothetical protein
VPGGAVHGDPRHPSPIPVRFRRYRPVRFSARYRQVRSVSNWAE